jgi:hypothetical protein
MGTWEHGKLRELPWDNALGGEEIPQKIHTEIKRKLFLLT